MKEVTWVCFHDLSISILVVHVLLLHNNFHIISILPSCLS